MPAIRAILILIALALTGCASTRTPNPADPLESFNRGIYKFNDTVDKAVIKPVARGYKAAIPAVGRLMISNFFSNLDDVVVTTNDLLQFKLVQGFSDGMRFFVNSTLGVFGLIDVATPGGLKKHNEDFGQTLGKWGIGEGPYLVLPFLGPSTMRDSVGIYVDTLPDPTYHISNIPTRNELYVTKKINRRAELLDQENVLDGAMIDPYEFIRDAYLQHRLSQVQDGNVPRHKYDDEDSNDTTSPPSSQVIPQTTPESSTQIPADTPPQNTPP
jgi:phospholipid-binding lipoprotein MlaA